MRLWSVHPRYLDRQALVACWREGLLAQAVLLGRTKGYQRHPQLQRFRELTDPAAAVGSFLEAVWAEATVRGYRFDASRIERLLPVEPEAATPVGAAAGARLAAGLADDTVLQIGSGLLQVTTGQLDYEWRHLLAKLRQRSPQVARQWMDVQRPQAHPLFAVVPGGIADWERVVAPVGAE